MDSTEPQLLIMHNNGKRILQSVSIVIFTIVIAVFAMTDTVQSEETKLTAGAGITKDMASSVSKAMARVNYTYSLTAGISRDMSIMLSQSLNNPHALGLESSDTNVVGAHNADIEAESETEVETQEDITSVSEQYEEGSEEIQDTKDVNIWPTSDKEWDELYASVRQEAGEDEEAAYAVVSTIYNRTQDKYFVASFGSTAMDQLRAPNQYTYSIDRKYKKYLGGKYGEAVVSGVQRCVQDGPMHNYTSFRTTGSTSHAGVDIGGNTFFGSIRPLD